MDFSGPNDKPRVPVNCMGERYIEIHQAVDPGSTRPRGAKVKAQRDLAIKMAKDPLVLSDCFRRSVELLQEKYVPRDEPFHPKRPKEAAWEADYIRSYTPETVVTSHVAARARRSGIELEGHGPITYVDRELKPVRTTRSVKQKPKSGIDLRLDLLLADGDQPIVAEVKCRHDENAYYALIQSLAAAAQLSSELQRRRLEKSYDQVELSTEKPLAVWIILCRHNSRGEEKGDLFDLTEKIAKEIMKRDKKFKEYVSEIRCVGADVRTDKVALTDHIDEGIAGWCAK